ncbi:MAG: carbon starvation CstA family protein, partial [Candidatus Omnitrophota bacterium]
MFFFELLIVIAVFALIIALIFSLFPASVFPVWIQIPIAVLLGIAIYKKKVNVTGATIIAIVCMYCTVFIGQYIPFVMPQCGIVPATALWIIILLIYVFIASTLPITTLLQPRDYINAWQLIIVMVILMASIIVSGITTDIHIVAPAFNLKPKGAPPLWPFLCLTIVCGAISGFHALVSSGTSSKQIAKPRDALFIGYGAMMLEAALATLVIVAVSAGS